MRINRHIKYIVILGLCVSMCGCGAMQRKFTRKKAVEKKPTPIIKTYDYAKELRVDELYKKHYLFWKSWQNELIDRVGEGYKKRTECYDELMANLMEMRKYLTGSKVAEIDGLITEIKSIELVVKKDTLTNNERYKVQQLLEKTKRQIEKRFSYSDVKGALSLRVL